MFRHILLASIVLAIAAAMALGDRGWGLTNRPGVALVSSLPAKVDPTKMRHFLVYSAILVPTPGQPELNMDGDDAVPTAPQLGFSYREIGILGMPFYAYSEFGMVLFDETPARVRMVPLDGDYMKLLEQEAGAPMGRDYRFPIERFIWGWALVAAFALWLFLQRRAETRERRELGLI